MRFLKTSIPGLIALSLATGTPAPVLAGETPIVVTATRLPTPRDEVGSTVAVITADEIERRQYRSVADALRAIPNLSMIPSGGGIGKLTVVFSRGTESNHTLFLLDGIEINDPSGTDGAVDLSHIYIGDVERIEVLNGPQGTLYGSDALGAVIHVITRQGEGPTHAWGMLEGGSFNTFTQAAGASGSGDALSWSASMQHTDTDGVSALGEAFRQSNGVLDDDRHENLSAGTRLVFDLSETASIDFSGRYSRTENDLDLNTTSVSDDSDSHGTAQQFFLGLNGRIALMDGLTEHRLGIGFTSIDREDRDNIDATNADDSSLETNRAWKRKVELQNDYYGFENGVLTLGLESEVDTVRSEVDITYFDFFTMAPGNISSSVNEKIHNYAAYLQYRFAKDDLSATTGIRIDRHDLFNSKTTGRFAISRSMPERGLRLRGSIATGFKAPTANQLFVDSAFSTSAGVTRFTGNPNLQPEESLGWELGLDKQLDNHDTHAGATYFENRIDDLITFNSTFDSNANRDRVRIRGIELYLDKQISESLSADLDAAFIRSIDQSTDENLLRRPLRKASASLDHVGSNATTLSIESIYTGPRYDIDAVTFARIRRGGYTLFNLAAGKRIGKQLELTGRVSNLTDKDYEEPDGFMQPGIGIYVGIRLSTDS